LTHRLGGGEEAADAATTLRTLRLLLELSCCFGVFGGWLLGYHTYLLATQQTSVEHAANSWRADVFDTDFGRRWVALNHRCAMQARFRGRRVRIMTTPTSSPLPVGQRLFDR
jgi:hypothetical protein